MPRLRRPCHLATPRELCGACGSPRQVCHATLDTLSIAHVDCDAFNATVEKRDRPDLVDRPVIIDGGSCGVVLACCYVARLYGVPLDDADVQRTGGLRGCGGDPIGHGEISRGRTRGARRDAAADAARRAVVDRRSLSRPWRYQGTPRRLSVPALHSPFGSKASSVSPCRSAGEADGVTRFRLIGVGADALVEGQAADPPTLFDLELDRPRWLEHAMDQIRGRLGGGSVRLGRDLPTAGNTSHPTTFRRREGW